MKKLITFGSKYTTPPPTAKVISVVYGGFLNPFYQERLRTQTGLDPEVKNFVRSTKNYGHKLLVLHDRIEEVEGDVVYLGCIGGQHRSVVIAEDLAAAYGYEVGHLDISRK